jgi:hypothetical protein
MVEKQGKIVFSLMLLIKEATDRGGRFISPMREILEKIPDAFDYLHDNIYYDVKVIKNIEYIWFEFDFGSPAPRAEVLTNINTGEKRPNARTTEESELNQQAFFLYHYKSKILYLSNLQKKTLFINLLKEKLSINFFIKSLYDGIDEFIGSLKHCTEISFTHVNNLFSSNSVMKTALIDLTGTDAPDEFTISAKYNAKTTQELIQNFIRRLNKEKKDRCIDALTICGFDDDNFQIVYNTETFSKRITIQCEKDENSKFIPDKVRLGLLMGINL